MLSTALPPFSALLVPTPQAWVRFIAGKVPAGFPSPAEDHLVERIDLMTKLVRHPQATFFVRIKGDSMRDAGILDGSIVMVDKAIKPRHGRGTLHLASAGTAGKDRTWEMKQERKTPEYTTDWKSLPLSG